MLTPGRLRDAVASCLNMDARSVDVHLRNLREAGLISKEKRGRGAAQVTAADAAALLVVATASPFVKDTVSTYKEYGLLRLRDRRVTLGDGRSSLRSVFRRKLPLGDPPSSGQTVLDVLSAILDSDLSEESRFRGGGFFPGIRPEDFTKSSRHGSRDYEPFVVARFFAPFRVVMVEWGGSPIFRDARRYGEFPPGFGDPRDVLRLGLHPGRVTTWSFGLPAAERISKALKDS